MGESGGRRVANLERNILEHMASPSFLLLKINQLGDAIWFLPTVAGIRREFPASRIDVVCNRSTAVIFEKSVKGVRAVAVSYKHVRSLRAMLILPWIVLKLGLGRYDYALLSHDEPKFSHLLALAVFARRRIGFDIVNRGLARLLSEVLPYGTGRNPVDLNFDLARRVTGRSDLPLVRVPLGYDPRDAETVERRLQALGVDPSLPFVVLQPFASLPYKEWGLGKFLALARRLTEEFDLPVVIESQKELPPLDWPRRIWGLSIPQLAALIERAALFIGNNSGPMNMAGAMGTPTLIAEGPWAGAQWGVPWTDAPHRRIYAKTLACIPCERYERVHLRCTNRDYPHGCMKELSVAAMFGHAKEMLEARGAAGGGRKRGGSI
jgi:heptosyltransferase-3